MYITWIPDTAMTARHSRNDHILTLLFVCVTAALDWIPNIQMSLVRSEMYGQSIQDDMVAQANLLLRWRSCRILYSCWWKSIMRTVWEMLTIHRSTLSILSFLASLEKSIGSPVVITNLTVLCEMTLIYATPIANFVNNQVSKRPFETDWTLAHGCNPPTQHTLLLKQNL